MGLCVTVRDIYLGRRGDSLTSARRESTIPRRSSSKPVSVRTNVSEDECLSLGFQPLLSSDWSVIDLSVRPLEV